MCSIASNYNLLDILYIQFTLYIKSSNIITWLCQQFNKVILIPGNHEYYTSNKYMTYTEVNKILIQLKQSFRILYQIIKKRKTKYKGTNKVLKAFNIY